MNSPTPSEPARVASPQEPSQQEPGLASTHATHQAADPSKLVAAEQRRRRRALRRSTSAAVALLVVIAATAGYLMFFGDPNSLSDTPLNSDYEPVSDADDNPAATTGNEAAQDDVWLRVVLAYDVGDLRADLGYSDQRGDTGVALAPALGGTGLQIGPGECGYQSVCSRGLPVRFDDDLDGLINPPAGAELPRDTPAWHTARRQCYESPRQTADCNTELALGGYGTLSRAGFNETCLTGLYVTRVSYTAPAASAVTGWWECTSPWWTPPSQTATGSNRTEQNRGLVVTPAQLCVTYTAHNVAGNVPDTQSVTAAPDNNSISEVSPACTQAITQAWAAASPLSDSAPARTDNTDTPNALVANKALMCAAATAVAGLNYPAVAQTVPPCGVWQRPPVETASLMMLRDVSERQQNLDSD